MSVQPPPIDVVLSAEQATLSTGWVPTERVRVRREVITEEMSITVTVRREVLRLERQPLGRRATNRAVDGDGDARVTGQVDPPGTAGGLAPETAGGDEVLEVVLSAERPVVSLEVVPYERVRLGVRSVATSTPVSIDLRREVADVTTEGP